MTNAVSTTFYEFIKQKKYSNKNRESNRRENENGKYCAPFRSKAIAHPN